jgi:hypothetical protein
VLSLANNDIGQFSRGKLKEKPTWWIESDHGVHGSRDDHYEDGNKGVAAIANAIKDMGALSSLDLSKNRLGGPFKYYSDKMPDGFGDFTATPEGPRAIADAIKDMEALTSLNLSLNNLSAEGGKIVAEAIEVTN